MRRCCSCLHALVVSRVKDIGIPWIFFLVLIILSLINPLRFPCIFYDYILEEDIPFQLESAYYDARKSPSSKMCQAPSTKIHKSIQDLNHSITEADLEEDMKRLFVSPGGIGKPQHCKSHFDVAIIVPYRNRSEQLTLFSYYIHRLLVTQEIEHHLFVVEQANEQPFNRAKLLNVGFQEASKLKDFHCFIFHDVDLIPLNEGNIYACTRRPRHMSVCIDSMRYTLPYCRIVGGAVAITKRQFLKINGFSNIYQGWGGEDDDFYRRLTEIGKFDVIRYDPVVSQYAMLYHPREEKGENRFQFTKPKDDGLKTLEYDVLDISLNPAYTKIKVQI
ncbi:unnamed protein product [Darwinula stevensoni]|uniref:Beta-1,4-N-acetylgalactosaminyltransferase n=1 Tax=Darwinula stevensoni TaxID=69355 RepID=A0A7R9AA24_9CRUS|nr:unnamed protein product [Darwinula stevensoni]CAG0897996.1 unnamed protein product [Darwinula stevensoni]